MSAASVHVSGGSLSDAWLRAVTHLAEQGVDALSPLVLNIDQFDQDNQPIEAPGFRDRLSAKLVSIDCPSVDTTARTIFPFPPSSYQAGRAALFERYLQVVPRLRKHPANRKGLYFERMVAFPAHDAENPINQLDAILSFWDAGTNRKSAFQVTTWSPDRDLSKNPYGRFPCLQHVVFTPIGPDELTVSAFYATQYLVKRAYGNYLGLGRLGAFMAHEMGRSLTRLTCYAAHAPMEGSKTSLRNLIAAVTAP